MRPKQWACHPEEENFPLGGCKQYCLTVQYPIKYTSGIVLTWEVTPALLGKLKVTVFAYILMNALKTQPRLYCITKQLSSTTIRTVDSGGKNTTLKAGQVSVCRIHTTSYLRRANQPALVCAPIHAQHFVRMSLQNSSCSYVELSHSFDLLCKLVHCWKWNYISTASVNRYSRLGYNTIIIFDTLIWNNNIEETTD